MSQMVKCVQPPRLRKSIVGAIEAVAVLLGGLAITAALATLVYVGLVWEPEHADVPLHERGFSPAIPYYAAFDLATRAPSSAMNFTRAHSLSRVGYSPVTFTPGITITSPLTYYISGRLVVEGKCATMILDPDRGRWITKRKSGCKP